MQCLAVSGHPGLALSRPCSGWDVRPGLGIHGHAVFKHRQLPTYAPKPIAATHGLIANYDHGPQGIRAGGDGPGRLVIFTSHLAVYSSAVERWGQEVW